VGEGWRKDSSVSFGDFALGGDCGTGVWTSV
jgi:hypothetical protein